MPAKTARTRSAATLRVVAPRKAASEPTARAALVAEPRTMSLPFIGADVGVSDRLLAATLAASIVLHAVVLALKFSPFDLSVLDRNGPPLEVALVNAKSKTKPTKAEILAQHNLDGGGNTDANRRAKTPLPVLPKESNSNELAVATQKVETLEKETRELMTQLRSATAVAPIVPNPTDVPEPPLLPSASEIMQRTLEAVRLEAQIAKEMDAYAKRPKRRFVGARAEEYRFARYVEDWRLKVERVGNLNYPESARTQKLYGSLLLTVGIRADGSVESIAVDRGSGQKMLDLAAQKIVEMASPYAAFPSDIKRDTDILYITRTWTFGPGDSLTSQ
jgi:periplasmic protein TonB